MWTSGKRWKLAQNASYDFYAGWYSLSNDASSNNISQTVRAIAKIRHIAFTEVDIRHRMVLIWTLYFVTLTFIFKVKHFVVHFFYLKKCTGSACPQQTCLESHGPRLALVSPFFFYRYSTELALLSYNKRTHCILLAISFVSVDS